MGFDFNARLDRLRAAMTEKGVGAVLLSVGADLPYLTGYEAFASERLTMLVIRSEGNPMLFIPELEAARVDAGELEVVTWGEQTDPVTLVANACDGAERVALGDHTWSVFLMRLLEQIPGTEWVPASQLTASLRMIKDPDEVAALRRAAEAVDRVLTRVPPEVRFGGRSELELARDLMRMTVEEGHQEATFAIVASGPNGASPHHESGSRVIETGDVVVCDFGGRYDGYHSDVTRTFSVGDPVPEHTELHRVVEAANLAGRETIGPGVACQDIDRAARSVIAEAGYGDFFIHRTGHGIGLEVHEHPYLIEGNEAVLEPGMAFSVEPGIYIPGRVGVRIEDIVVCGESAVDELNRASRDLVIVA